MKQLVRCLATTVVLAAGISSAAAQSASKDPIKVGILLGLTGTSAGYTLDERRAAEAVTEKVNRQDGEASCQRGHMRRPACRISRESVEQHQRRPRAGGLDVEVHTVHQEAGH